MNRAELKDASEQFIRDALRRHLPPGTPVYLYGSRARGDAAWSSDYDLWVDADLPEHIVVDILDEIEESFVPFHVDIVTTPRLRGRFGQHIRAEAKSWI